LSSHGTTPPDEAGLFVAPLTSALTASDSPLLDPVVVDPDSDDRDDRPVHAALRGPQVRDMTFLGRDDEQLQVRGRLLAFGTSERDAHSHPVDVSLTTHDPGRYASKSERCSACRWFEVTIVAVEAEFSSTGDCTCEAIVRATEHVTPNRDPRVHLSDCGWESPGGAYLVVTAGRSRVPGEQTRRRAEFTDSPFEVIELLVQRREHNRRFIPQISARALASAAAHDPHIREAYVQLAA
jgi:hypothetical protein